VYGVAGVIVFNFLAIVVEKEVDPYPCPENPTPQEPCLQRYRPLWGALDDVCNAIFIIELALNYYGSGPARFWCGKNMPFGSGPGWNIFDFLVVMVGALSLCRVPLGSFAQIKIMRTFRVFRLFKRVKSLNKIIVALMNSIPGVINAFAIMTIFMFIYAIIAVDYFRDFGGGYAVNSYLTLQGNGVEGAFNTSVSAMTARGYTIGDEYYGTFSRSLFTLFQVLTGESWSEAIARPLVFGFPSEEGGAAFVAIFYISFLLLMQIVLVNVVVAVLLDKFVGPEEQPPPEEDEEGAPASEPSAAGGTATPKDGNSGKAPEVLALEGQLQVLGQKMDNILSQLEQLQQKKADSADASTSPNFTWPGGGHAHGPSVA